MSLINEALKRTRDASYQNAAPKPPDLTGYRYGGAGHGVSSNTRTWIAVTALAVIGGLGAGSIFLVRSLNARPQPVAAVAVLPPVEPAPPQQPVDDALVAQVVEKLKADPIAATPVPAPAPVVAAPPEPPKLTLQGVTSQGTFREAMINGNTVRLGDEIDGARLIAIENRRVRLQWRDRELVLRMP